MCRYGRPSYRWSRGESSAGVVVLGLAYFGAKSSERTVSWVRSLLFDRLVDRSTSYVVCQFSRKVLNPSPQSGNPLAA